MAKWRYLRQKGNWRNSKAHNAHIFEVFYGFWNSDSNRTRIKRLPHSSSNITSEGILEA
jgi:hypothetical protein